MWRRSDGTLELPQAITKLSEKLHLCLHSSIVDPSILHTTTFLAFLEAALSQKGIKGRHQATLDCLYSCLPENAQKAAKSAIPYAADVLEKVEETMQGSSIVKEGNIQWIVSEVGRFHEGEIEKVIIVDALSPIEFAAILLSSWRNSFHCTLMPKVFVNPRGATRFVKRQVGKEQEGYLWNYADELKRVVKAFTFEVQPLFDKMLHENIGDIVSFLQKRPFLPIWECIAGTHQERLFSYTCRVLVTSDHGYNVFEDKTGTLYVGHGGGEKALLRLDSVSLFAILSRRGQ